MQRFTHALYPQAMASGALLHFRNLSAPDPHGVTEDEAAAAHVYTQDTLFFRVLNEQLRGTDRSKVEPYKPYTPPSPSSPPISRLCRPSDF